MIEVRCMPISDGDLDLNSLKGAAEENRSVPAIFLVVRGSLISGIPTASARFVEVTETKLAEGVYYELNPTRETRDATYRQAIEQASTLTSFLSRDHSDSGHASLTLRDARIFVGSTGGAIDVPVIRVTLQSVDAWWVSGGKTVGGNQGFFGGFVST